MEPLARIPGRSDDFEDREQRDAIDRAVDGLRRRTRFANLGAFTGYRIGLDIGNGNIGWCILFENGSRLHFLTDEDIASHNARLPRDKTRTQLPNFKDFVPLGTYKFEARENSQKGEKSFSKIRAEVKAKSRGLDAQQYRRFHVKMALQKANLLPKQGVGLQRHKRTTADVLRAKLLEPSSYQNETTTSLAHRHDLGRALYNALKRRGYMKPVGRAGLKEDSRFGSNATEAYREALKHFKCRTIGEFLEWCARDARRDNIKFRKRHKSLAWQKENKRRKAKDGATVKSYEALQFLSPTFTLVWKECELLRDTAKDAGIVIDDRAWAEIKAAAEWRRELEARIPGPCEFLKGKYRCIRALPSFQSFRILEQITHLRDYHGNELDERTFGTARSLLEQNERMTLAALSRELETQLKLDRNDKTGSRYLLGAKTDIALTRAFGQKWTSLPIEERDSWTMKLLRRHRPPPQGQEFAPWRESDEEALEREFSATFGADALENANEVAKKFEDKFSSMSVEAACCLAKFYGRRLEGGERRLDFDKRQAALRAAGAADPFLPLYEQLPYYGAIMPDAVVPAKGFAPKERTDEEEWQYGRAANPDVHVVMNRLRIVINEIIKMMGGILPSTCVIEMARSAFSEEQANAYSKTATARARVRERIVVEIEKILESKTPAGPGLDKLVDRWKAAIRQGWRDYDGSLIQPSALIDAATYQLDHVVPAAFGDFRENNIFVSRFNQTKGRRLPWEAFGNDSNFRPALIAFAKFGLDQQIKGLEYTLKPKPPRLPPKGEKRKRLEEGLARARKELDRLSKFDEPRPDVLNALNRTLTADVDALLAVDLDSGEQSRQKEKVRPFRPGDQAALFRRFHPDRTRPESGPAARDIANIGWNTKLARRYVRHLGAECESIKAWAVHALRCMFDIKKDRTDLRNHAVDAFLVAHFDKRILCPAFAGLRHDLRYEEIYDTRAVKGALAGITGGSDMFDCIARNLDGLDKLLRAGTIGTAHRADHKWNPGDRMGGTFGAFGKENVYSFRPTLNERKELTNLLKRFGTAVADGHVLTRQEILEYVMAEPTDEKDRKRRNKFAAEIELRYRSRDEKAKSKDDKSEDQASQIEKPDKAKDKKRKKRDKNFVPLDYPTALPLACQPGAFINDEGKFAVIGAAKKADRRVVGISDFSTMSLEQRRAMFSDNAPIYRSGDTVACDGAAYVVTGLQADTRLIAYPLDDSLHRKDQKNWITPGSDVVKLSCDVLGRRVHRLRKNRGGLKPVPYTLRGK
jgi:hypothetical protein